MSKVKSTPICASIRSENQAQYRCLMKASYGEKYCPMHLLQTVHTDFAMINEDIINIDQMISQPTTIITNDLISKITIEPVVKLERPIPAACKKSIPIEQNVSTIEAAIKENDDDLEIKLLILVNDDDYNNKISKLIGPVFNDITLSEDDQDPITFDDIWTMKNGVKVAASVNKYYLFSYKDLSDKIRCMTLFTMFSLINENNLIHPSTQEPIPEEAIERAKCLIELYQQKVGMFKEMDVNMSREYLLKNRLTKLFKKFHIHSIYFEEKWLLDIDNVDKLYKIIRETDQFIPNNLSSINPALGSLPIFKKKKQGYVKAKGKTSSNQKSISAGESIIELQEYIIDEWEKLIQAANNPQNQIPIWIIAIGLSNVVPEVKQKYPDLEFMLS